MTRKIKIVKIIPHDTWERLLAWCNSAAWRIDVDNKLNNEAMDQLNKILAEVEK